MKKIFFSVVLLAAVASNLKAQDFFSYWGDRWDAYVSAASSAPAFLLQRYFNQEVSVEEMKEAFHLHKDDGADASIYAVFDSVSGLRNSLMLVSPLQRHPDKKVRECRGVWSATRQLTDLVDKNGKSQPQLLEKLNKNGKTQWLDGERLRLTEPRSYMGFTVSPCVCWEILQEGKPLADARTEADCPDFFSYAEVTTMTLDGTWDSHIQSGARLLGAMCGLDYAPLRGDQGERSFSVLLYQKPTPARVKYLDRPYALELLEPADADKETRRLFEALQSFVASLPDKTFKPYYTTDFRVMTGRYYRVTVNKCGWLVEDYLKK
ncbi:MAG: DUF5030 domain-containing protein [Bacteroidaceae bacterium]|nr:DUF5030 domain-containing protein [Bacteroidaceae bacterium]